MPYIVIVLAYAWTAHRLGRPSRDHRPSRSAPRTPARVITFPVRGARLGGASAEGRS